MSETSNATESLPAPKPPGRNDPCTCGSGKKYKKCCGFNVTPNVSTASGTGMPEIPSPIPGFDPSSLSPEWIQQVSQAFARLPKGQRQKLEAVISKAMAGKDVTRESADLEKNLPVELQSLLNAAPVPDPVSAPTPEGGEEAEQTSKSTKFWRKLFKKK